MNYKEWEEEVATEIKSGPVWKLYAYPKALFLYDFVGRLRLLAERPKGMGDYWANYPQRRFHQCQH